jgi:hypothetical protein
MKAHDVKSVLTGISCLVSRNVVPNTISCGCGLRSWSSHMQGNCRGIEAVLRSVQG